MFLEIEAVLTVLALVLALTVPRLGSRWFEAIEQSFGWLAKRQGLSVIVVGLTALALRAALLPILPIPVPAVNDEFGYLLLADTFAHGRLTNPTNPMWVHFESFFTIWHPTYTAMYYPAQGLVMALGQVLTGKPFWGVWLSVGLMCAAITWMLQGWLEPGWALLGGFLAMIRLGTFSYWANSYYGGAVAAFGGALVLGALPRLKKERRVRHALLMGLGFAIIGNSRPYEGLFFGVPVAVALMVWLWKMKQSELSWALKRTVTPFLAVITLTLVAMGYYNWRTTGSPLSTPYLVYIHTYSPAPYFPWQRPRAVPLYHHADLKLLLLNFDMGRYWLSQSVQGLTRIELDGLLQFWNFYLGFIFTFPLLLALATVPYGSSLKSISHRTRFLVLICGVTLAGEALPIWYNPHYSAPITCAILALVLVAMRRLRLWEWRGKPAGKFITRAIPSICVLLLILRTSVGPLRLPWTRPWPVAGMLTWCSPIPSNRARAKVLAELEQVPGRQLVIVHYRRDRGIHKVLFDEWVYNKADLNSAKVIWAHDMGPIQNEQLIHYFKHRHVWLVYADDHPPKLIPYSESADRVTWSTAPKSP